MNEKHLIHQIILYCLNVRVIIRGSSLEEMYEIKGDGAAKWSPSHCT